MEDTLAAAEKTLGASFRRSARRWNASPPLGEGLRKIDDMIDRVTRPGSGFVGSVDDRGGRRGVRGGSSDAAARRRRSACAVGGRSSEARRKTPRVGDSDSRSNRGLGSLRRRSLPSSPVAESVAESVESDDELDDELDVDARELAALDERGSERGSAARASVSRRRLRRPPSRFLSPPRVARRVSAATRCFVGTRPVSTPLGWTRRFVDSSTSSAKYRRPVASRVLPSRSAFVPWETAGAGFPRTTRWRVSGTDSDAWRRSRGGGRRSRAHETQTRSRVSRDGDEMVFSRGSSPSRTRARTKNLSRATTGCYGSGTKTASAGRARRPPGERRPPPNSRARRRRDSARRRFGRWWRAKKAETVPTRSDLKRASERAAAKSAAKAARAKRRAARAEEDEDE